MRHPTADEAAPVRAALRTYHAVKRDADRRVREAMEAVQDATDALKEVCDAPSAANLDQLCEHWLHPETGQPLEF